MAKKPGLNLEEHVAIGQLLKRMRDELGQIWVTCGGNAYPKNGKEARAAAAACRAISNLKSALEEAAIRDLPKEEWSTNIYYGKSG